MRYENYITKIKEALNKHKTEVDCLVKIYETEIQNHKSEIEKMRGVYTKEYISEYDKKWKPKTNYHEVISKSSEKATVETEIYLGKIKKELDRYFDSPVRQDFVNKINAIALTGLTLKDREFKLLVDSASNYMEMRMVQQLAENRTKQECITKIGDNGNVKQEEVAVKNPYRFELADVDYVYNSFDDFSNSARHLAKYYAGNRAELKEFLTEASEYAPLTADSFFRNNAIDKFSKVMDKANACLPESKIKRTLTETEKKFIDTLVDRQYPEFAAERVRTLAEADRDIEELLRLDERYSSFLEDK